jgi:ribonuclease VapC
MGSPQVIVDSSALVAIARNEPDIERYVRALTAASRPLISAATYVETAVVVESSRRPDEIRVFDQAFEEFGIGVEPFTEAHALAARAAYRRFGKGSGHRARLNLGDCFSYALAKATGEPLLYKGDDFTHTDVRSALE